MVRIQFAIDLQYELTSPCADFVFNFHAAQTARQTVISEKLQISQTTATIIQTDEPEALIGWLDRHGYRRGYGADS